MSMNATDIDEQFAVVVAAVVLNYNAGVSVAISQNRSVFIKTNINLNVSRFLRQ